MGMAWSLALLGAGRRCQQAVGLSAPPLEVRRARQKEALSDG
jgi:hypothetical protein